MLLNYIKKYEKSSIFASLMMVAVAVLLIIKPDTMLNLVVIILGAGILLDGIIHVVSYILTSKEMKAYSNDLFIGIIGVLAGVIILVGKTIIISMIPIIIGIWLIVKAIIKLQIGLNLKSLEQKSWLEIFIMALVSFAFGVLVLLNPFGTAITVTVISGVFLLITAISDIIESFYIISKIK